jgi:hypothetical protein
LVREWREEGRAREGEGRGGKGERRRGQRKRNNTIEMTEDTMLEGQTGEISSWTFGASSLWT